MAGQHSQRVSPHVPDLDALEVLLAVAATGSFGQTATQRGISQPAISARVRRMEALVGVPLIERGPRGSVLTPAGALVADWAKDVLTAAQTLDAGIASLRTGRDGRLRVASSLTVAEQLLPRWLVQLAAALPDTAVSLSAVNSAEVATAVLRGDADLGFVEGPTLASGLQGRVVARDRLVVIVPPDHPWARRRRPLAASELAATRLVSREPESGTRAALERALRAYAPLAAPMLELSTASGVRSAVAAGAGPAVLSTLAVREDVEAHRIVEVPVTGARLDRSLRAVWPSGRRPAGPARDLLAIAFRQR
jgi:DNA-binding transcriptional LysR family regulator